MDGLTLAAIIVTVAMALLFDFSNGFHDTANATSTVIATRSLSPKQAVILSAVFNFLPAVLGADAVANTIATIVNIDALPAVDGVPLGIRVALAALLGAVLWNFLTWSVGMPSSSSHALIGGLIGAGLSAGGADVITWAAVTKVAVAIAASPVIAFAVAVLASLVIRGAIKFTRLDADHAVFRWGQVASTALLSWGHGSNDAQKTMGVIAATLYSAGALAAESAKKLRPPLWVVLAAHTAIAAGTAFGGWRIISTVAFNITRIVRASGLAANVGAVAAIEGATTLGVPISTTHAATSSVVGSGVGFSETVQLRTIRNMVLTWLVTLPCAGVVGSVVFQATVLPGGWAMVVTSALVLALLAWTTHLMLRSTSARDIEATLAASAAACVPAAAPAPLTGAVEGGSAAVAVQQCEDESADARLVGLAAGAVVETAQLCSHSSEDAGRLLSTPAMRGDSNAGRLLSSQAVEQVPTASAVSVGDDAVGAQCLNTGGSSLDPVADMTEQPR